MFLYDVIEWVKAEDQDGIYTGYPKIFFSAESGLSFEVPGSNSMEAETVRQYVIKKLHYIYIMFVSSYIILPKNMQF